MRLFRPGFLPGILFPGAIFRAKSRGKELYLTFDDGPNPDSTFLLLSLLEKYDIRALFFCKGIAAEQHPDLMRLLVAKGHQIGNHGYSHYDGWKTEAGKYVEDVYKAAPLTSDRFFRPPFGHITFRQYKRLKGNYRIVIWDVMAYDFDSSFGSRRALSVLNKLVRPGSVIVLHDSHESNTLTFIEEFIMHALSKGYTFANPADILS